MVKISAANLTPNACSVPFDSACCSMQCHSTATPERRSPTDKLCSSLFEGFAKRFDPIVKTVKMTVFITIMIELKMKFERRYLSMVFILTYIFGFFNRIILYYGS